MLQEYTYHWLHIPTGKTGTTTAEFSSRSDLLENLNYWNQSCSPNRKEWKYWTEEWGPHIYDI